MNPGSDEEEVSNTNEDCIVFERRGAKNHREQANVVKVAELKSDSGYGKRAQTYENRCQLKEQGCAKKSHKKC